MERSIASDRMNDRRIDNRESAWPLNHIQDITDNQVTNYNAGVESGFPDILVSTTFLSTAVSSLELCYRQFIIFILQLLKYIADSGRNVVPSLIATKLLDAF